MILLVLAAQRLAGRRLQPRWRSALWLLVILRLSLPSTLPSRVSVFNLVKAPGIRALWAGIQVHRNGLASIDSDQAELSSVGSKQADLQPPSSTAGPLWALRVSWMLKLWGTGVLVFAGLLLTMQFRLSSRFRRRKPIINCEVANIFEACKDEMGIGRALPLAETPGVESPCIHGFIRPRLFLPVGFTQDFTPEEMRYIFLHELAHVKRHDIFVGWLVSGLQVLHWFNPLVWLAAHRMRLDRELACDAQALSHTRAGENERYGRTIIKLLENLSRSTWTPSLAGAVENNNHMKERIHMIATFRKTGGGLPFAAVLFCALALATLTDAQSAPQSGTELVGTWVLIGRPGQTGAPPAVGGRIKTLTDTHWSVTQTDSRTDTVLFRHGGTWKLKGDEYSENVEYANQNTRELVGKTSRFHISLQDDTLTIVGIGNPWREVWKRVKADVPKPKMVEPTALQGTWAGSEVAGRSPGVATMQIHGANLEFHGGDTNEWYKGTFSAFDTAPQQIVIQITDCPFADYVGKTAYAIFRVQDGKLTVSGNEPGNPTSPAGFEAPGAREFVFERK